MGKGGKIAMIIIGAVLLIVGIYYAATAGTATAAFDAALSLCGTSTTCRALVTGNPAYQLAAAAVTTTMIIGIILLAIGAVLLIVGLLKLKSA